MITTAENKSATAKTTPEKVTDLRRQAYALAQKALDDERAERRRRNEERRQAELEFLKANPTHLLVIGGVDDVIHEDRRTGDIEVHEVEVLYEKGKPNPVAQRWPDGSVHWLRNPLYLAKAGIDVTKFDLGLDSKPEKPKRTPRQRRLRAFTSRNA